MLRAVVMLAIFADVPRETPTEMQFYNRCDLALGLQILLQPVVSPGSLNQDSGGLLETVRKRAQCAVRELGTQRRNSRRRLNG